MWLPRVLTVFMSFTTILAQQESLVELQLSLREDEVPAIITYLLDSHLEEHGITTADIIKLSKLDRYNENDLREVLNYYEITEVYNVDNLKVLLTGVGMSFGEFNRDLTSKLGLTNQQAGQVLTDLEIPPEFWRAVALNDDKIYNILKQGKYDEEHVSAALQTAGKSISEVYAAGRDSIAERVTQLPATAFMDILRANGWTVTSALPLYEALKLTTQDVYNVPVFRDVLLNITDTLNQNVSLGVFVGPEQIAIHKLLYHDLRMIVDGVNIRIAGKDSEVHLARTEPLGENIVGLGVTPSRSDYIEIIETYNDTESCSYITSVKGDVRVATVQVEDFVVEKTEQTEFVLGGALVCEGKLYGLAGGENETAIFFDYFYTEDHPAPPEDFNSGVSFSPKFLTFIFIIALL